MKSRIYALAALAIIILSILAPIFLPKYIENNPTYGNQIGAGDLLGYIGALFASIITMLGLGWTFSDNRRGIKEQGRLDVLPFIGINVLNKEYRLTLFSNVTDVHIESQAIKGKSANEQYYREHKLDEIFFIIEEDRIKATNALSKEQQNLITSNGMAFEEIKNGVRSLVSKQLIFVPIELCNFGNGPAVDVRLALNIRKTQRKRLVLPVTLAVNEKVYVGIYCETNRIQAPKDYSFEMYYMDIFGNVYKQAIDLFIKNEETKGILLTFDTQTKQERVSKDELKRLCETD